MTPPPVDHGVCRPLAPVPATDPSGWLSVVLADLADVEDLLDALDHAGAAEREVAADGNARFVVRWRLKGGAP